MNGLTILAHSFRQVTGNLGMAIKVSGWLVAIYVIGGAVLMSTMPEWLDAALDQNLQGMTDASEISGGSVGLVLLLTLAAIVFLFWSVSLVAIVWHRYILLEEIPQGVIPYRADFRIGRYFWLGVGISLLAALVVGMVSGILGMIFGPFFMSSMQGVAEGAVGVAFLMGLIIGTIVAVLYLRMALVLPAVALDDSLTIGQAWEKTSGHTGAIIGLALALAFINMVVPMVISLAFGELVWVNLAFMGLYQWFYFMLGISILSTLYGHIVQKREVY